MYAKWGAGAVFLVVSMAVARARAPGSTARDSWPHSQAAAAPVSEIARMAVADPLAVSQDDPAPRPGDRVLFDIRESLQRVTDNSAARALFDKILWEQQPPYGWSFAANFDGSGRNAMRGAMRGRGRECGDGGEGQFVIDLPSPHPDRLYVQYRMHLGRHPLDNGATVGKVGFWMIKNLVAPRGSCGLVGKKEIYVDRDDGDRLDHDWFSGGGWSEPRTQWQWVGHGSLQPLSAWNVDAMAGKEVLYTVYYDVSRVPGTIRQWANGVLVGQARVNLGMTTFKTVRLSNVFSDPGEDMTRYIWDVVVWEPRP